MSLKEKKKQILNKITGVYSGAKETAGNLISAYKSTSQAKENIKQLAISKAKKLYSERTGRDMTSSVLKDSGMLYKPAKLYKKDKKNFIEEYSKKFKL